MPNFFSQDAQADPRTEGIDFGEEIINVGDTLETESNQTLKVDEEFYTTLDSVAAETERGLKKYYETDDVKVELISKRRDLSEQLEHFTSGASKTPLSLHNFGAAGDFAIYINGERVLANGTNGIKGSTTPYQILGHYAREKELFWGWEWDSGHVGETRYTTQFLKDNPQLKDDENVKKLFEALKEQKRIPQNLQGLVETLEGFYGEEIEKEYYGNSAGQEKLLSTIKP